MFAIGINVCLFIQLIVAGRRIKFTWMKGVTCITFVLVSLGQSLLSYVTIISSNHHFKALNSPDMAFGSSNSRSIQSTIMAIGMSSIWILDGCMVRSNL